MSQDSRNLEIYNDLLDTDQSIVCTFTYTPVGDIDPVEDINDATPVVHDAVIVFVKTSVNKSYPKDFQLERGDRVIIGAALGELPSHGDYFTINSQNWEVLANIESSAGDDSLFRSFIKLG